MNTVRRLLNQKGKKAETIRPDASIVECAQQMKDQRISSLVVTTDDTLRGIITWHDLLDVVAEHGDRLSSVKVKEVMSTDLVTTTEEAELKKIEETMIDRHIHHVPVIEDGELVGVVTREDILSNRLDAAKTMNEELEDYIMSTHPAIVTSARIP